MPRNGRIRMVGKSDGREREMRADELADLERELHRQWRRRRAVRRDDLVADEPEGRSPVPVAA